MAPGVGIDFSWYFAHHWGVGVGVEAAFPNMYLFAGEVYRAPLYSDALSTTLHKRTSHIYATYLRLPLWAHFRAPLRRHWFYAAAGASLDIALAGRYRTEMEVRAGVGTTTSSQTTVTTGSLSFGHGVSLAAEAGFRWTLTRHWGLYTGAYATYGLSDIRPTNHDLFRDVSRLNLLQAGVKVKIVISD
jgi:hypothetical protein